MHALAMTDNSRKTPPPPATSKKPRGQTQDERDMEGFAARREREAAALVSDYAADDLTGKYEGAELEEERDHRPPIERIKRLERKSDAHKTELKEIRTDVKELSGHVSNLRADVAGFGGKIDGQESVLSEMLSIVKKGAEREHVTFTAQVEVDKERALSEVEVDKERALSEVEVDRQEQLDKFAKRDARRKLVVKGMGLLASGGGIVELLHRLGVL